MIRFFLERHLLVHIITIVVFVVGWFVLTQSQREGFPGVTLNQSVITTLLPGGSPEDIESKLTRPIEEAIADLDGIDSYASISSENLSIVTVDFYADFDPEEVEAAERDIQKALDAMTNLPGDLETPPILSRFDPAKMNVLEVAIKGPWKELRAVADGLAGQIERLEGVGKVEIVGIGEREVHVFVDPTDAVRQGVTLDEVMAAIQKRNVASTGGKLAAYPTQRQVVLSGEYRSLEEIGDTILRFNPMGGGSLRLGDVAEIVEADEETGLLAHADGARAVSVIIRKRRTADILNLVDGVRAELADVKLPPGVSVSMFNDQSRLTRNRLEVVYSNGLGGVVLVLLVLVMFLSVRVAFWVAFGLPFCLMGVLALLPAVNITINMISMAGFVLVIGIVVDDAIVIAERIAFFMEKGLEPIEAAIQGTKEMSVPVIGSSLTTVLAFSPMFTLGGMPGKFAWAIPAIVILTLLVSLFECFFILPSHLAGGSKAGETKKANWLEKLEARYHRFLTWVLPHGGKVALLFGALFVFSVHHAATSMPVMLFPQDDSDAVFVKVRMPLGTPIERTEAALSALEKQVPQIVGKDLEGVTARVGHLEVERTLRNQGSAEHEGFITAYLTNEREYSAHIWIERLREDLAIPAEAEVILEPKRIGPPLGKPVTVHVSADDPKTRLSSANDVKSYLERLPGVIDLESDDKQGMRQMDLRLDYEGLALKRIPVETVARAIKASFFGLPVSDLKTQEGEERIRVRFDRSARTDIELLLAMPVRADDGKTYALRDVVIPVEVDALAEIHRREGVRTTTLTARIEPSSGETATSLAGRISRELLPRYGNAGPELRVYVGGEATKSAETLGEMPTVFVMAVFGIIMVVTLLTGSILQAIFVISAIPLGMIGVIWAYDTHGIAISMFAMLGITGLSGVVVNDSIVMVTSLNRRAEAAGNVTDMIEIVAGGAAERLRPVLLTTMTTVAGVMPTAYGLGGRDALLSPMSVALGYGLIFGTAITLVLVPALYVMRIRIETAVAGLFGRGQSD
jgi:multidrug efflux pump subunit AcrB